VNDYILNWLAHIIQKPEKKIGTALVFRSSQGAGKSLVTDFVGKQVIGALHYLYCNDMDKVIGKFNGLSANLLLVCSDEVSSWGGAYKSNNRLKSLITQDTSIIEMKGLDPIQVPRSSKLLVQYQRELANQKGGHVPQIWLF
jgi:hypothetical protein